MAQARPKVPDELATLPNNKWEQIIDNYIKSEDDRAMAKMYYLDGITQAEIAAELNYSRSTIKRRLPKILNIIEKYQKWTPNEPQEFFFYGKMKSERRVICKVIKHFCYMLFFCLFKGSGINV